ELCAERVPAARRTGRRKPSRCPAFDLARPLEDGRVPGDWTTDVRLREELDHTAPDLLGVGAKLTQDSHRDAFGLADEAQQDVLGSDVSVAERERFARR